MLEALMHEHVFTWSLAGWLWLARCFVMGSISLQPVVADAADACKLRIKLEAVYYQLHRTPP